MKPDFYKLPVIFLDIDGVMTNYTDKKGSYVTHTGNSYGISETNLKLLKKLVKTTGAVVIISSNWRKFIDDGTWRFKDEPVRNPLPELKRLLGNLYFGDLPHDRHINKSQALTLWFELNNLDYRKCRFVIFDDDLREGFQDYIYMNNFILTNPETGLTQKDCEKAEKILKETDKIK